MYCSSLHYKIQRFRQLLFVLILDELGSLKLNKYRFKTWGSFQELAYKKSMLTATKFTEYNKVQFLKKENLFIQAMIV